MVLDGVFGNAATLAASDKSWEVGSEAEEDAAWASCRSDDDNPLPIFPVDRILICACSMIFFGLEP